MSTSTISLPKPILVGSGLLLALGLFLAAGDPGKVERAQLSQTLTETQQRVTLLEAKLTEQETKNQNQIELLQLSTRRLELAEENTAHLRTHIDEVERQLAQRKQVSAPIRQPIVVTKPLIKTPIKPVTKPVAAKPATIIKH
jgi:hypothetical protein